MYDLYAVDITARKPVESHHILGVVIFYIQKVSYLTIRILGEIAAHSNIHQLIALHSHEVNSICMPPID